MHLRFRAIHEKKPGVKWQALFESAWPAYRSWFLKEGDGRRPGYLSCRGALERHMPELVPLWERLVELAGGGDQEARLLSLYRPTPYLSGCSQAVWARSEPFLVRNYDYHPERCEGTVLMSAWHGTKVIAQTDCLWGVLDGINEHGLAVSLSFGGRQIVGDGFGIPLVLRYILEFCRSTKEASAVLDRVPSHMAYNVSVVDVDGDSATAHVAPDQPTQFMPSVVATNHQREIEWTQHAEATHSVEREEFLTQRVWDVDETPESLIKRFLKPPVFSTDYRHAFGTLYTAVYHPQRRQAEYRWPNHSWRQPLDGFDEGEVLIRYGSESHPPRD